MKRKQTAIMLILISLLALNGRDIFGNANRSMQYSGSRQIQGINESRLINVKTPAPSVHLHAAQVIPKQVQVKLEVLGGADISLVDRAGEEFYPQNGILKEQLRYQLEVGSQDLTNRRDVDANTVAQIDCYTGGLQHGLNDRDVGNELGLRVAHNISAELNAEYNLGELRDPPGVQDLSSTRDILAAEAPGRYQAVNLIGNLNGKDAVELRNTGNERWNVPENTDDKKSPLQTDVTNSLRI